MEPQSRAARALLRARGRGFVTFAQLLVAVVVVGGALLLPVPFVPRVAAPDAATAGAPDRVELPAKRTATSKTFRNDDGTLTTELYAEPIHFRGSDGGWHEIGSQLVPANVPGYALRNEGNSFEALFKDEPTDGFLRFSVRGEAFDFSLAEAGAARARATGRSLSYGGVFDGVDLQYEIVPEGVKETLTLDDAAARSQFRFTMSPPAGAAAEAKSNPDGSSSFYTAAQP